MDQRIQLKIEKIAKNQGLHDYVIETLDALKGMGFMGIITPVKIIGKNNKGETKELNLILKSASQSDAFRKEMRIESVFNTEIIMYGTVLPILKSLEIKHGLTPSTFTPKLFGTISDHKYETLIMEDLRNDYQLHPAGCTMEDSHVSLVLRKYGQLHAISFALREQEPQKFHELTKNMKNDYVPACGMLKKGLLAMCEKALLALDSEKDLEVIQKYKTFMASFDDICDELLNIKRDKYCTILHGDAWSNNLLFTYQDKKDLKQPTDVRMVDFQFSRLEHPVTDLSNFIYCSCNKGILDNLEHYLKIYYESFSNHLRKLGGDPDVCYPYSILQEHWRKYAKFNMFLTPMFVQVGELEGSERPDLENAAEGDSNSVSDSFNMAISNVDKFNDRMRHTILHLVNNNFM